MEHKVKVVDIDSFKHRVIMNTTECGKLGMHSSDRVMIVSKTNTVVAILETSDTYVNEGEVSLYLKTTEELKVAKDDLVRIEPTDRPTSVEYIKKKMKGKELDKAEIKTIVEDITSGLISDVELSAYVTATFIHGMNMRETTDLAEAMVATGEIIEFSKGPIFDYHSIGGSPGNKITLVVVPIVAASGMLIPKTSSRAVSSACGTADIMETICNITLDVNEIREQTETIGGTLAWGGGVNIAPADDIIIRAEYPLAIDPYSQVLASVMAKKRGGGAEFLLMDIPTGPNTKMEDMETARELARDFSELGKRLGMKVECAITYGGKPVGRTIGPALEIKEAMEFMEGKEVPDSFSSKSLGIAGILLEMGGKAPTGMGKKLAKEIVDDGRALKKFMEIVVAQGGDPNLTSDNLPMGKYQVEVLSKRDGYINSIHNKKIVKIARAAGCPQDKGAGILFLQKSGRVEVGQPLMVLYSNNEKRLEDARMLANTLEPMEIEGMLKERYADYHSV